MIAILLAAGMAASLGAADYLGGFASRGNPVPRVLLSAHLASLALVAILVSLLPPAHLTTTDVAWSVAAGVLCLLGIGALYRGLAGGPMAIVSPVSAVLGAVVPVAVALALGERLSPAGWAGVALGLVATVLVSLGPGSNAHRDSRAVTVALSVVAGVCLGGFIAMIAQCSAASGQMPLLIVRLVTVTVLLGVVMATGRRSGRIRILPTHPGLAALAGMLDIGGTVLFILARPHGPLAVIAVIGAQYPLVTVLLARFGLGERLLRRQLVGLAVALVAVALLAVGRG